MAGFDWAKPANVYVAGVAVLWVLFVGVIAALYVAFRLVTGAATSGAPPAALLAAGGAIAAALGRWLLGHAKRWAAECRAPRDVIRVLGFWSLGEIAVVTLLVVTIGAATSSGPWPESLLAEAAGRWPAMLVDYGFFWAVVVSVVPIPFLETQYRPAGTIVPAPSSEAPRRVAVKIGNGQAFVAVDEVLAVTAAESSSQPGEKPGSLPTHGEIVSSSSPRPANPSCARLENALARERHQGEAYGIARKADRCSRTDRVALDRVAGAAHRPNATLEHRLLVRARVCNTLAPVGGTAAPPHRLTRKRRCA